MNTDWQIFGVDFSGSEQAGRKIWLARLQAVGEGLRLMDIFPAAELAGSGSTREKAIRALRDSIANSPMHTIFGLDFPFSLPTFLITQTRWDEFVLHFEEDYPNPEEFRAFCLEVTGGRELKRQTDIDARVPFCAYNLRLFKQTFYGIRDLLAPLVRDEGVSVLPMQRAMDLPWLIEVCPASTLKKMAAYFPYKGSSEAHLQSRQRIVQQLKEVFRLEIEAGFEQRLLSDGQGDALDSLIAACTTYRVLNEPRLLFLYGDTWPEYMLEGHVYV